jgi:hypothetical protein
MVLCGPARVLLAFGLLLPPVADAQGLAFWTELVDNIARSSNLNTRPGSTIERDVQALIFFFNNTCTASQGDPNDAANPYRGAFAQVSQWRQNEGWQSIVEAHSNVQVQCRTLYMEGGEEFAAKHCFWNIGSLEQMGGANGTSLVPLIRYPDPEWTIVFDCCEQLERPVLRVYDAVWATTKGVGRAHRAESAESATTQNNYERADDIDYVPRINCDEPMNAENIECDAGSNNIYQPIGSGNTPCSMDSGCGGAVKPAGVRSKHYFNVGLAVGERYAIHSSDFCMALSYSTLSLSRNRAHLLIRRRAHRPSPPRRLLSPVPVASPPPHPPLPPSHPPCTSAQKPAHLAEAQSSARWTVAILGTACVVAPALARRCLTSSQYRSMSASAASGTRARTTRPSVMTISTASAFSCSTWMGPHRRATMRASTYAHCPEHIIWRMALARRPHHAVFLLT